MTQPRFVLDTNVLLSALLFHAGSLSWLRHAWQSGTIRPLASRDTTAELLRVLSYPKFRLTDDEREDVLGDYLPWCETVTVPNPIDVPGFPAAATPPETAMPVECYDKRALRCAGIITNPIAV